MLTIYNPNPDYGGSSPIDSVAGPRTPECTQSFEIRNVVPDAGDIVMRNYQFYADCLRIGPRSLQLSFGPTSCLVVLAKTETGTYKEFM